MTHLNARVPCHDNRWDGTICRNPSGNSHCLDLERIHSTRDDAVEITYAGSMSANVVINILDGSHCRCDCGCWRSGPTIAPAAERAVARSRVAARVREEVFPVT